jgi:hypothetical protein
MYMKCLLNKMSITAVCTAGLLLVLFGVVLAGPNEGMDSPRAGFASGESTNGLQAEISWETKQDEQQSFQNVRISILTRRTNGVAGYLLPPSRKLAKAELRDKTGASIEAVSGKRLDDELAQQIAVKDLPHFPPRAHHTNLTMPKNMLGLSANIPHVLWDFPIQDIYRIEHEGDYTFNIVVGVYYFVNAQSVERMDLPEVTIHMHLTPTAKAKG